MNSINFIPTHFSTINSLHLSPSSAVSEESLDLKDSSLKAVEQSSEITKDPSSLSSKQAVYEKNAEGQQVEQDKIDQQTLQRLSTLDREVRNHEQAHAAVGGQYAGAPRYEYERGPDGVNYAVAGEVSISTSAINGDPEGTIEKARIVLQAALAPAEPSAQDRKVAADAAQLKTEAQAELVQVEREERLEEQRIEEEEKVDQQADILLDDNEPTELINKTQEDIFNEINKDLSAQLVALGGSQQSPRSLGSIINRLA